MVDIVRKCAKQFLLTFIKLKNIVQVKFNKGFIYKFVSHRFFNFLTCQRTFIKITGFFMGFPISSGAV